jgi:hypothetical protein
MFIHPEHLCDHTNQRYQQILTEANVCRKSQERMTSRITGLLSRLDQCFVVWRQHLHLLPHRVELPRKPAGNRIAHDLELDKYA